MIYYTGQDGSVRALGSNELAHYNHNHDKLGRFSTSSGAVRRAAGRANRAEDRMQSRQKKIAELNSKINSDRNQKRMMKAAKYEAKLSKAQMKARRANRKQARGKELSDRDRKKLDRVAKYENALAGKTRKNDKWEAKKEKLEWKNYKDQKKIDKIINKYGEKTMKEVRADLRIRDIDGIIGDTIAKGGRYNKELFDSFRNSYEAKDPKVRKYLDDYEKQVKKAGWLQDDSKKSKSLATKIKYSSPLDVVFGVSNAIDERKAISKSGLTKEEYRAVNSDSKMESLSKKYAKAQYLGKDTKGIEKQMDARRDEILKKANSVEKDKKIINDDKWQKLSLNTVKSLESGLDTGDFSKYYEDEKKLVSYEEKLKKKRK